MNKLKNEEILVKKLLLINSKGENLGEKTIEEAMELAEDHECDLVQVGNGEVPVCKLIDYSKMAYNEQKKKKKKNAADKIKEVRFRTAIGEHDIQTKISHIDKFLKKGFKVQVTIQTNRRQRGNIAVAKDLLEDILGKVETVHTILNDPVMKGNFYSTTISPSGTKKAKG